MVRKPEYIVLPPFKFTKIYTSGTAFRPVITQKPIIPIDYVDQQDFFPAPFYHVKYTGFQLNALEQYFKSQSEVVLFMKSVLGFKNFYEEVVLCILLNVFPNLPQPDGTFTNVTEQRSEESGVLREEDAAGWRAVMDELTAILQLYTNTLQSIVQVVLTKTVGKVGSRRKIYEHFFFGGHDVQNDKDPIYNTLLGVELTQPDNTIAMNNLKKEVSSLSAYDDVPIVDLLDIPLERYSMFMKLVPKENIWFKNRMERFKFFDTIITDIDSYIDTDLKFQLLQKKYNTLRSGFEAKKLKTEELKVLSDLIEKDVLGNMQKKLDSIKGKLKSFVQIYNDSGQIKYKGKVLPQSSSIINDLLNSQFMEFMNAVTTRHNILLTQSINQKLNVAAAQGQVPSQRAQSESLAQQKDPGQMDAAIVQSNLENVNRLKQSYAAQLDNLYALANTKLTKQNQRGTFRDIDSLRTQLEAMDITNQKRIEDEIQELSTRVQTLSETTPMETS